MNYKRVLAILVCSFAAMAISAANGEEASVAPNSGDTYVLVHGAWGGGWDWRGMERRLEAKGHTVYRPTLTGHGERSHLASPDINLTTHVTDVVNLLKWEQLEGVILVGHSYGGMVITGAAERAPERLDRLIYLDAVVPEDGESLNAAFGREDSDSNSPGRVEGGFSVPPWVGQGAEIPHDVPHSLACFTEALSLANDARMEIPTTYIYYVDPGLETSEDTFYPFYQRAKNYGWDLVTREGWDHNAHRSHPEELVGLLLAD